MNLLKKNILLIILRVYFFLILATCKWKTHNLSILKNAMKNKKPIMLSCWHENLVFFTCFFKSWERPVHVISSSHPDSNVLANILKSWGFKLIKGSSTRGWLSVLKNLLLVFKKKGSITAITHDGPKGPPKKSKPGALRAAIKNKVCIIGMRGKASKYWRAKSWDKTFLPKPFSTIEIYFYPEYQGNENVISLNKYLNKNEGK